MVSFEKSEDYLGFDKLICELFFFSNQQGFQTLFFNKLVCVC